LVKRKGPGDKKKGVPHQMQNHRQGKGRPKKQRGTAKNPKKTTLYSSKKIVGAEKRTQVLSGRSKRVRKDLGDPRLTKNMKGLGKDTQHVKAWGGKGERDLEGKIRPPCWETAGGWQVL